MVNINKLFNSRITRNTERKTEDNKLFTQRVRFYFCFAKIMSQNAPLFLHLLTMRRFTMNERLHAYGLNDKVKQL